MLVDPPLKRYKKTVLNRIDRGILKFVVKRYILKVQKNIKNIYNNCERLLAVTVLFSSV